MKQLFTLLFILVVFLFAGSLSAQIDTIPPIVHILKPLDGTYTSCDNQAVWLCIRDESPILRSSIFLTLTLTDTVVRMEDTSATIFDTLVVFPAPVLFRNGERVNLRFAPVSDIFLNESEPVVWDFYVDLEPPVIDIVRPAPGSTVDNIHPEIVADIHDLLTAVRAESLLVVINGSKRYTIDSSGVLWDGSRLTLAGLSFSGGDTVRVCIRADDMVDYCTPNRVVRCFEFYIESGGPTAEAIFPFEGAYLSCPDTTVLLRIFDANGVDPDSILMLVNDDTLSLLDTSYLSFDGETLRIDYPFVPGANRIAVLRATDVLGNPLEEPLDFLIYFDTDSPYIWELTPSPGETLYTTAPPVSFRIADSVSGLGFEPNPLLASLSDGYSFTLWDSEYVSFDGELFSILPNSVVFSAGESVSVCVNAYDSPDFCPPNHLYRCWYFFIDGNPPYAELITPLLGQVSSCDDQRIRILIHDPAGIDTASIGLRVGGLFYNYLSFELTLSGDTLIFSPSTLWENGELVQIVLESVSDTIGNVGYNLLNSYFYVDLEPPRITYRYPAPSQIATDTLQEILVMLEDNLSPVDSENVILQVNGVNYTIDSTELAYTDGLLRFNPSSPFGSIDTVKVCVSALRDIPDICEPNVAPDECWQFYIDSREPNFFPPDGMITACHFQEAKMYLWSPIGFIDDSLIINVNGFDYSPADEEVTYEFDTLRYIPPVDWSDGDTVDVMLVHATDGVYVLDSIPWQFIVDYSPPIITGFLPPVGETLLTVTPVLRFSVVDSIAGVDTSDVEVEINGFVPSPLGVDVSDTLIELDVSYAGVSLSGGDTVNICFHIPDRVSVAYCGPNELDSCFTYFIESGGPTATLIYPYDGAVSACEEQRILFLLSDSNGVMESSIRLEVNGVVYTVADTQLSFSDDTLAFIFDELPPSGSLVSVGLLSADDSLRNPLDEPLSFEYTVDYEPPVLDFVYPLPGTTVVSTDIPVVILLSDSGSGISDFTPMVNGEEITDYSFSGDTLFFSVSADSVDTVSVCVRSLSDNATLCGPNVAPDSCIRFFVDAAPPVYSFLSPPSGVWSSCPYQQIQLLFDETSALELESISLVVNSDTFRFGELPIRVVNDTLIYTPAVPFSDGNMVTASISGVSDIWGNRNLETISLTFRIDLSPPVLSSLSPDDGFSVPELVSFVLRDSLSGVDFSTLEIDFDTLHLDSSSSCVMIEGDTLVRLDMSDFVFVGGDTITVCIDVSDRAVICPSNELDSCFDYVIPTGGPEIVVIHPADASISSCPDQQILAQLIDTNGVISDSIIMAINGATVSFDFSDSYLSYTPIGFYPSDSVYVCLDNIMDSLFNLSEPLPFCWYFVIDTLPPVMEADPAGGSVIGDTFPTIDITLSDNRTSVLVDSLVVDGLPVDFAFDGEHLIYTPSEPLFDTVSVCIFASDEAQYCGANRLDSCYEFVIDPRGPSISPVIPFPDARISCDDFGFRLLLLDDYGIDSSTISVHLGDSAITGFDFSSDTLTFEYPLGIFPEGSLSVYVFAANVLGNRSELTFNIILDRTPPYISDFYPADGEVVLDTLAEVGVCIEDLLSPVELGSVHLLIDTVDYSFGGGLSVVDSFFVFSPELAGVMFLERDTVDVTVFASDSVDFCPSNEMEPYHLSFIIGDDDTTGPLFSGFSPTYQNVGVPFYIECDIRDTSGVYDDSTGSDGQGVYLVWDIDGELDTTVSGEVKLSELAPSRFRTDEMLSPLFGGEDFVYEVFAFDNDFDHSLCEDRTQGRGGVKRVYPISFHLLVSDTLLDFGDVCRNDTAVYPLVITNMDTLPIELTVISEMKPAFGSDFSPLTVEPADSCFFDFFFSPMEVREYADTVYLYSAEFGLVPVARIYLLGRGVSCLPDRFTAGPNPFTPNGDGANDEFRLRFTTDTDFYKVRFFTLDSYPVRVLEGDGVSTPIWDGRDDSGSPCRQGIYIYIVERNGKFYASGKVVLAR